MHSITHLQKSFEDYLSNYCKSDDEPQNLYKPIKYILNIGGKRIRPLLALLTCDVFGANHEKVLDAALAVEMFHNFTLMHDDIMDKAPLRRGQETVHEKWDVNTGILSGDAMLILSNQILENYSGDVHKQLVGVFNKMALEVCEGQQYDIDFETRNDVTIVDYLKMIEFKTSVLVGASMQMGAIVAGASIDDQKGIYDFGRNLGIAFQIQDDYLDAFGNPETFGKQVGGDIIENKKTFLFLKALELGDISTKKQLQNLYELDNTDSTFKIDKTKHYFESSGAVKATKEAITKFTNLAFEILDRIDLPKKKKAILKEFGLWLMKRTL